MARTVKALGSCFGVAALLLPLACGQAALPAARPAPRPDIETRVLPQKQPLELPRLLAPPPAYGNKIVMARLERGSAAN